MKQRYSSTNNTGIVGHLLGGKRTMVFLYIIQNNYRLEMDHVRTKAMKILEECIRENVCDFRLDNDSLGGHKKHKVS